MAFAEQVIDADGNQKTVLHYYTYTASEVLFDGQTGTTQDPADSDYMVSIETDGTEKVITITNSTPLPETGGMGTHWFALLGILLVGVGILLTRKDTYGGEPDGTGPPDDKIFRPPRTGRRAGERLWPHGQNQPR